MQVIESLTSTGPMTAGQLADLTGLTTGAITGMFNRLEETGLVRRERDPEDGRRVLVRLNPDTEQIRGFGPSFDAIGKALELDRHVLLVHASCLPIPRSRSTGPHPCACA